MTFVTTAEYCVLGDAIRPAQYVPNFLHDLSLVETNEPLSLCTESDNVDTAAIIKGPKPAARLLDIRYSFVRDALQKGELRLLRVD